MRIGAGPRSHHGSHHHSRGHAQEAGATGWQVFVANCSKSACGENTGLPSCSIAPSARVWFDDGIVIDPDSRLTQLGLISVCDPARYVFFNSRSYGGESDGCLPDLAAQWAADPMARPFIAPKPAAGPAPDITVS